MGIYFLVFSICFFCSLVSISYDKVKSIFYLYIAIICIFFSCLRVHVGGDYYRYIDLFESIVKKVENPKDTLEIGYKYINYFVYKMGLSIHHVYFITTIIIFINLYKAFDSMGINPCLAIFLYFSLLFTISVLGMVRQGIATSFIYYAFSEYTNKKKIKSILLLLLGSCFHYVALIIIPFIFFIDKKFSNRFRVIVLIISIIFSTSSFFNDFIIKIILKSFSASYTIVKILTYATANRVSRFGLGTLLRVFIFIFYLFFIKKSELSQKNNIMAINLSWFFLVATFLFANIPTLSERLANVFFIGYVYIFYDLFVKYLKERKYPLFMFVLLFVLVFFRQDISIPGKNGDPGYIPYHHVQLY